MADTDAYQADPAGSAALSTQNKKLPTKQTNKLLKKSRCRVW